jgi:vitamin B12/bleomycin/antimicrobial peptide transport system ATP-binding/permease protein
MAEQSSKPANGAEIPGVPARARDGFYAQFMGMVAALWTSRQRNKLILLAVALIAVVGTTAFAQLRLNAWNGPFYNALSHKNLPVFIEQLGVFALLASLLLVLNVAQMWLNQTCKVALREGLVKDLMTEWLAPRRAFRLSNAGEIGANPDQRIQEDAKHLTDLTTDLGIGLLQSSLLLLSFIGVLWVLSGHMELSLAGHSFSPPPGYMVWCALIYAGVASFVSWRVGRPLINLNAEHYAREAEFRFALVRVNEEIDGITLYRGEADERGRLDSVFATVLEVSRRIVRAVTRLTWVTAGYGWFTIVAPILVAAPAYFQGTMSFGELMVIVGAFNQVQQSLRWFVDNFTNIADWRATLLRVASFRITILTMDELGRTSSRITFDESEDQSIRIDELHVAAPAGCIKLSEPHAELKPGERIHIVGENGEEKSLLFRAVGGLWPWGSGRITRPSRDALMFLPVRAYVPPGELRAAVTYPHSTDVYEMAVINKAFADVGLEHLQPLLDTTDRWDRRLNDDEKQCIAFARVLLHRPQWVVSNDALMVLDPASRARIEAIFAGELASVGVVSIGAAEAPGDFFTRILHLVRDQHGPSFNPAHGRRSTDLREAEREALSID